MSSENLMANGVWTGWVIGSGRTWHRVHQGIVLCGAKISVARMHELGYNDHPDRCKKCRAELRKIDARNAIR